MEPWRNMTSTPPCNSGRRDEEEEDEDHDSSSSLQEINQQDSLAHALMLGNPRVRRRVDPWGTLMMGNSRVDPSSNDRAIQPAASPLALPISTGFSIITTRNDFLVQVMTHQVLDIEEVFRLLSLIPDGEEQTDNSNGERSQRAYRQDEDDQHLRQDGGDAPQ
jgi:hypothetical protein